MSSKKYKEVWISEEVKSSAGGCGPEKPPLRTLTARLYHPEGKIEGAEEPSDRAVFFAITSRDHGYAQEKIERIIDQAIRDDLQPLP